MHAMRKDRPGLLAVVLAIGRMPKSLEPRVQSRPGRVPPELLIAEIRPLDSHEARFNSHVDDIDQVNSRCQTAKLLCGMGNGSLKRNRGRR